MDERREHGVSGSNQEPEGHEIGGGRPSPTGGEGSVVGNTREERGAGIMGDPGRMKNGEVRGTGDRCPRTRPGGGGTPSGEGFGGSGDPKIEFGRRFAASKRNVLQ